MEEIAFKPCPTCGKSASVGSIKFSQPTPIWNADGTNRTEGFYVHCTECQMNNNGIVHGYQTRDEAIEAWNTRAFPSESDIKLLNALWEYLDDTGDGAPDSSSLARQNLNFSEPLHQLIRRLK